MNEIRYPDWQMFYEEALRESDLQKLHTFVHQAEEAIFLRMLELTNTPDGKEERQAIREACNGLLAIKMDKLRWPWSGLEQKEYQANSDPV